MGVCGYVWVCADVHGCTWGCADVHRYVWDEFSEYLLENRVPTSADFNTYPIRIFELCFFTKYIQKMPKSIDF